MRASMTAAYVSQRVFEATGFRPRLADYGFCSITLGEIKAAAKESWLPWKQEKWDCDNQAAAAWVELMKQGYTDTSRTGQPAAGTMQASIDDGRHAFLWWIDLGGMVHFYDTTFHGELHRDTFRNPAPL